MNYAINKIRAVVLPVFLLFIFSTIHVSAEDKKKILYISSGMPTHTSTQIPKEGFDDLLKDDYEIYYEYLNSLQYPDKEREEAFYTLLSYKLKLYSKFDAVVFVDDSASAFGLKYRDLFGDSKIFLSSIVDQDIVEGAKEKNIESVIKKLNPIEENVSIIGDIYKGSIKRKTLTLLTGPENIYEEEIKEFYLLEDKYPNLKFDNKSLDFSSEENLRSDFSDFDKDNDILLFYMPNNHTGSKVADIYESSFTSMRDIYRCIEGSTSAPIFSTLSLGVEYRILGGYTIDLYKQGRITAEVVKEYLENNYSVSSEVDGKDASRLIFNDKELIKHGISRSKLPKGAEIKYESEYFFVKYQRELTILFILFLFLVMIIIFLIIDHISSKKNKKNLEISKKIAEDANMAKNKFIANISHELRTPANVISSSVQLIKRKTEIKDDIDKKSLISSLDMIEINSYRLIRLVNNIIDVTKADTGFKSIVFKNVEIISLIENTVLSVVPFAETRNLNIVLDTEIEELIMAVDIEKIERIILNLLSNAIKFSYEKGTIFTHISRKDDMLTILVKDEGIGIAKESIDKIFDRFVQIDNEFTRLNEGSGIGLSLVKSFIDLHDGKIQVESELGKGSCFIISLPIKKVEGEEVVYNSMIEGYNTITELSDIYNK